MALKPLTPGYLPMGQYDLLDSFAANFVGGEVGVLGVSKGKGPFEGVSCSDFYWEIGTMRRCPATNPADSKWLSSVMLSTTERTSWPVLTCRAIDQSVSPGTTTISW
jgi:hypothetical protein